MAKTAVELLALAAQSATAQGGAIAVSGITQLAVTASASVVSGTLTVFLQESCDGGKTWTDLPYEYGLVAAPSNHTAGTLSTQGRNILSAIVAVASAGAHYEKFGNQVRVAWVISGAGATATFQVEAVGA